MSRSQSLYKLQQVDTEKGSISLRLKKIASSLGESQLLKRARQQVADLEGELVKCRTHNRDLDLEIRSLNQRIEANEKRLYSGKVANPKELANLQDDTDSLKRWRTKKEEDLLEAMLLEEETESALIQAEVRLTEINAEWESQQQELMSEKSRLETRLEDLGQQREALTAVIRAEDLTTYQNLFKKKAGRAVVAVTNSICEGCRMPPPTSQIQQAGSGNQLVFCSNCGRILYVP